MPLTDDQIRFIETHIKVPMIFGRAAAEQKRDLWATEFRAFNARREDIRGKVNGLADANAKAGLIAELDRAEDIITASPGTPDFEGGTKHLDAVETEVKSYILLEKVRAEMAEAQKIVDLIAQSDADNKDKIMTYWAYAQGKAEKGETTLLADDLNSVLLTIPKIYDLVLEAESAALPGQGNIAALKTELAKDKERRAPRAELSTAQVASEELLAVLSARFGAPLPNTLTAKETALRDSLDVDPDGEPAAIRQGAAAIEKARQELDAVAKPVLEAQDAWDKARAATIARFSVLQRHPSASDPNWVKPLVDQVEQQIEAAKLLADGHDYGTAKTDIEAVLIACNTAIESADTFAEFDSLYQDRRQRVTALFNEFQKYATHANALVQQAVAKPAVKDLYDDALAAFNAADAAVQAGNYPQMKAARAGLVAIPEKAAKAIWACRQAAIYAWNSDDLTKKITKLEQLDQADNDVGPEIAKLKKQVADAAPGDPPDFPLASSKLDGAYPFLAIVEGLKGSAKTFRAARVAFLARQAEITAMAGTGWETAVAEYAKRLERDLELADDRVKMPRREFDMATAILNGSLGGHRFEVQKGTNAKAVVEKLALYRGNIAGIVAGEPTFQAVADLKACLDDIEAKTRIPDWDQAFLMLPVADRLYSMASSIKAADQGFEAANNTAQVDAMAPATIAAAFQVYTDCRKLVTDKNATDFAAGLQTADGQRDAAQASADAAPPQFDAAKQDLKLAIAECRTLLSLAVRKENFGSRLQWLRDEHTKKSKPEWNIEDVLKTDLDEMKQKLDTAEQAAKAPANDLDTAEPLLVEADEILTRAIKKANQFVDIRANRGEVRTCKIYLEEDTRRAGCTEEIAKLDENLREVAAEQAAGRIAQASEKAKAGYALVSGYYAIANQYFWYGKTIADKHGPAMQDLPATRTYSGPEDAELTKVEQQRTANAAAKNYAAANGLAYSSMALARRIRILERDGAAWTQQHDDLQSKLAALKARITPAHPVLTARIAELDATFDTAKEQAKPEIRNYAGAVERAKGLEAQIADAGLLVDAYLASVAAQTEATARHGELNGVGNPAGIVPLIARVNASFTQAQALQDAGSFTAAEALFSEVARDCILAIQALANLSEYADLVSDLEQVADDDAEDGLETALRRAGMFIEDLKASEDVMYIFGSISAAEEALKEARGFADAGNKAKAKEKIIEVSNLCTTARTDLGLYVQLSQSFHFAEDQIGNLLKNHPQVGLVRPELRAELEAMTAAMNTVRQDHTTVAAATAVVEHALETCETLRPVLDKHAEAVFLIGEIQALIRKLESHAARYAVLDELKKVRSDLEKGQQDAMDRNHDAALLVLNAARADARSALLRAAMESDEVPELDDLKDFMAQPGGIEKLDKIIENLDATTKRKVMKAVFEARFGCELAIYGDGAWAKEEMKAFKASTIPVTPEDIAKKEAELEEFKKRDPAPAPHEIKRYEDQLVAMRVPAASDAQIQQKQQELNDLKARTVPAPATPDEIAAMVAQLNQMKSAGRRPPNEAEIAKKQQDVNILDRSANYNPDMEGKAPNIQRFYEKMSGLPDTATLDNDSLGLFVAKLGRKDGSYFAPERREVCVGEGDVGAEFYYGLGLAHEIEELDYPLAEGENLTLFNWNTLHEVGHAVDDKLGYMKNHPNLGDWKTYGADVMPIAQIIADKYLYDAAYVAAYMNNNSDPAKPDPGRGADAAEWEARRLDCRAFVDRIRTNQNPWQSASAAKRSAIGDGGAARCYQESYPGNWTSYPLSARKEGVSGYQFRAPGEWFSELYAAYYSKKLQAGHPALTWLEADFPKPA